MSGQAPRTSPSALWYELERLRIAIQNIQLMVASIDKTAGTTFLTGKRVWDGKLIQDVEFNDINSLNLDATILNLSGVASISLASTGAGISQGQIEVRADQKLFVKTPAWLNATLQAGYVLTVTDPVEGQCEFTPPRSQVLSGIGNPNGVVTATGPAIYFDNTNPTAPIQYVKCTSGTSNNQWI